MTEIIDGMPDATDATDTTDTTDTTGSGIDQ